MLKWTIWNRWTGALFKERRFCWTIPTGVAWQWEETRSQVERETRRREKKETNESMICRWIVCFVKSNQSMVRFETKRREEREESNWNNSNYSIRNQVWMTSTAVSICFSPNERMKSKRRCPSSFFITDILADRSRSPSPVQRFVSNETDENGSSRPFYNIFSLPIARWIFSVTFVFFQIRKVETKVIVLSRRRMLLTRTHFEETKNLEKRAQLSPIIN